MTGDVLPVFSSIAAYDREAARALSRPILKGDLYKVQSPILNESKGFPPEPSYPVAALAVYLSTTDDQVHRSAVLLKDPTRRYDQNWISTRFAQHYRENVGQSQELGDRLTQDPIARLGEMAVELTRRSGEPVVGAFTMFIGQRSGQAYSGLMIPRTVYREAPTELRTRLESYSGQLLLDGMSQDEVDNVVAAVKPFTQKEADGSNLGLGFLAAAVHIPEPAAVRDVLRGRSK